MGELIAVLGSIAGIVGLFMGVGRVIAGVRRKQRVSRAAIADDLFPSFRGLRNASWAFIKPLGGGAPERIIEMYGAMSEVVDLREAVEDPDLSRLITEILETPAASIVASIDPDRFMGLAMNDDGLQDFHLLADLADQAMERCLVLRTRGS